MNTLKIIKIGGHIIDNDSELDHFIKNFAKITGPKILVHGGGKLATRLAQNMNTPVKIIEGRRITDSETLQIITMVYAGGINKNIVAKLQANNCNTIGLSGADGNTIIAKKRPVNKIDYGFVGDVVKVNTALIKKLIKSDLALSFCPISHNKKGQLLNTNADTIAAELAIALAKDFEVELYYCFEKNGVLKDINSPTSVIETIDLISYQNLKEQGLIVNGMLPKLDNCFYALQHGVKTVRIGKPEMVFETEIKHTTITL